MGAPSRLKRPPAPTKAPVLERIDELGMMEKVGDIQGRMEIVHNSRTPPRRSILGVWITFDGHFTKEIVLVSCRRCIGVLAAGY